MIKEFREHKVFMLVACLVLFLSFTINLFGAMRTDLFVSNYSDSEALIVNQVACKGQIYGNQLLMAKDTKISQEVLNCSPEAVIPYSSQYGLQGKLYALGYNVLTKIVDVSPAAYISLARIFTALLSVLTFSIFILWVKLKFGSFVASITTLLIALSPVIVGIGRNLYWTLPLLVLPFTYALYAYKLKSTPRQKLAFWTIIALLFYARYLCGYEFITTVTLMVMAAIFYHLYIARSTFRIYMRELSLAFIISVICFAAALGTHIYSLKSSAGSFDAAVKVIKSRALERTANTSSYLIYPFSGFRSNLGETYLISDHYLRLEQRSQGNSRFWANLVSVMHYNLMPVVSLPLTLNQPFSTYIQSTLALLLALGALFVKRRKIFTKIRAREIDGLFVGAGAGFIGYLSWLILARAHSLVHVQINGVLIYLPFGLFGYIILSIYLESIVRKHLRKSK